VLKRICPPILRVTRHWQNSAAFLLAMPTEPTAPLIVFVDAEQPFTPALLETLSSDDCVVVLCAAPMTLTSKADVCRLHEHYGANILFTPFTDDSVRDVLERSRNHLAAKILSRTADEMLGEKVQTLAAPSLRYCALPTARGEEIFRCVDIIFCEADGQNTICYSLLDSDVAPLGAAGSGTVRSTVIFLMLSDIETLLSKGDFVRVHHSFIVGLRHVGVFKHNGKDGLLTMQFGEPIAVSRTYKKALVERLQIGKRA
jgi:hypothetical protein